MVRVTVTNLLSVFEEILKNLPDFKVGLINEGTDDGLGRLWADEMETFASLIYESRCVRT